MITKPPTLAVIIGNRDFFPDALVTEARTDVLALFDRLQIEPIILSEETTKLGAVETWEHAKPCGDLFGRHRDRIDGVLVCLPNFGDEKGVADALKLSGLSFQGGKTPCRSSCRPTRTISISCTSRAAATPSAARSPSATIFASTESHSR